MLYVHNPLAAWALGETVVARVFGEYCGVQEVLRGFAGHAIREIGSEPFGVSAGALPRTQDRGLPPRSAKPFPGWKARQKPPMQARSCRKGPPASHPARAQRREQTDSGRNTAANKAPPERRSRRGRRPVPATDTSGRRRKSIAGTGHHHLTPHCATRAVHTA
jgi:hypothetical protein